MHERSASQFVSLLKLASLRRFAFSRSRPEFNAKITPLQAVLRYRDLLKVENLFLRTTAVMRTRPIFHSSNAGIRGHVFCSFLALAMQKHLNDLTRENGLALEWKRLLRDLDALQQVQIRHRGADWLCFSTQAGLPPNGAQSIEIAHKDASLVGSRSVPTGTPPSFAFSPLHQSARRDFVGVPLGC